MDLASAHENYVTRMLDAAKGGMKALVCDPATVRIETRAHRHVFDYARAHRARTLDAPLTTLASTQVNILSVVMSQSEVLSREVRASRPHVVERPTNANLILLRELDELDELARQPSTD